MTRKKRNERHRTALSLALLVCLALAGCGGGGSGGGGKRDLSCFFSTCQGEDTAAPPREPLMWAKTFGAGGDDYARSIRQTPDGGYILAGALREASDTCANSNVADVDIWVLRLDETGRVAWNTIFGQECYDLAFSVDVAPDGNFVVAGMSMRPAFSTTSADIWVSKINSEGDSVWEKNFGATQGQFQSENANAVLATAGGGLIAVGTADSYTADGENKAVALRLDASGNQVWMRTLGATGTAMNGRDVRQTADGGFVVLAFDEDDKHAIVWKLDSSGNTIWEKSNGDSVYGFSIRETADGGFIITGEKFDGLQLAMWLMKLDSGGNLVWEKTFGGTKSDYGNSVAQTADGGYIVSGVTRTYATGTACAGQQACADGWIVKTDSSGNKLWDRTFGGTGNDSLSSIQPAADGGFITAGYTESSGAGEADVWVLKLSASGTCEGCF